MFDSVVGSNSAPFQIPINFCNEIIEVPWYISVRPSALNPSASFSISVKLDKIDVPNITPADNSSSSNSNKKEYSSDQVVELRDDPVYFQIVNDKSSTDNAMLNITVYNVQGGIAELEIFQGSRLPFADCYEVSAFSSHILHVDRSQKRKKKLINRFLYFRPRD